MNVWSLRTIVFVVAVLLTGGAVAQVDVDQLESRTGFFNLLWDDRDGRMYLSIDSLDEPFIYQTSLARGIGSNDIGLDRGQLGATKVVRFVKTGPKILLVEDNLNFRAESDNPDEKNAIAESFASSVIWGFTQAATGDGAIIVDATDFFVRDAHGVSAHLNAIGEGVYGVDGTRSALYLPRTKAFPDNTEVEAVVTFVGEASGALLPTVAADDGAITVHVHHSFIRLPDNDYEALPYDPRAGIIGLRYGDKGYADYASAIGDELMQDFGRRHRLKKVDPAAAMSEAVEPIVYYLDRGAPEPVRSALLEGARWWNQAFEAAGYKDAFQVRLLPEDADPMDVRYNVIQWVHRSTRGWSYGASVLDPRTGEILKGHVTLGSLRVRQDYLIAEGLTAPYVGDDVPPQMLQMSLARIRQLSAHEVGHTLGFEHNFAASTQDRSSVMDYPVPRIIITDTGNLDLSDAYDDKIGRWDIRTVLYAYQDYPAGVDAGNARRAMLQETIRSGLKYVADGDSRSPAMAHPDGNLWDNGADAIDELEHLLRVRDIALSNFSERNVRRGRPLATLEEVLVPIYLLHRFQLHAVGKLLGGYHYSYDLRGDEQSAMSAVTRERQLQAMGALLDTLEPSLLRLSDDLIATISPRPPNYPKTRETFHADTGVVFDPLAPAASSVALSLEVLLDPYRAARMARSGEPGFAELTAELLDRTWFANTVGGTTGAIQRQTNLQTLYALLGLAFNAEADGEVRAIAMDAAMSVDRWLSKQSVRNSVLRAHYAYAQFEIERLRHDPAAIETVMPAVVPPGSPIGSLSRDFN